MLIHMRKAAFVATLILASLAAGCGGRVLPPPSAAPPPPPLSTPDLPDPLPLPPATDPAPSPRRPEALQVENWEAFAYSTRRLQEEIARKDAALGARDTAEAPVDLASLRLAAEGWRLVQEGNSDRAIDLLERAIGLDGRNGFAYLFVAYAYHRMALFEQGASFLERAERHLPSLLSPGSETSVKSGVDLALSLGVDPSSAGP